MKKPQHKSNNKNHSKPITKAQAEEILTEWHGSVNYWTQAKIDMLLGKLGYKE